MTMLKNKTILLIISGGIAAYKSLELIRLLRKGGASVRCILTQGGARFVTPLSVSALSESPVYSDLWSLKDETEMGHIRLSREADLIVVAPASANMIAKMAGGMADDLAAATLLAADKPILIAPAMNHKMWEHEATQLNIEILDQRGVQLIGPEEGDMACGEYGPGRMSEPEDILHAIQTHFVQSQPLTGLKALVTSGPTYEPIDPVRFIGNRSSGKQGHAIASALAEMGADVTLVSGPTALPDPDGTATTRVETAAQMLESCEAVLPVHIAVCAAAVSDWGPKDKKDQKIKKRRNHTAPSVPLKENPDILARLSKPGPNRPSLVIGFAAETEKLIQNAKEKLLRKGCDWILANDVSSPEKGFDGDENRVYLVTKSKTEDWPQATKKEIAEKLGKEIAAHFKAKPIRTAA